VAGVLPSSDIEIPAQPPLMQVKADLWRALGKMRRSTFVEVDRKPEAAIDLAELKDGDGNIEVSVGDRAHLR
jgi:hypothetical protein